MGVTQLAEIPKGAEKKSKASFAITLRFNKEDNAKRWDLGQKIIKIAELANMKLPMVLEHLIDTGIEEYEKMLLAKQKEKKATIKISR